jgi:hypothetical protein
VRAWHSTSLDRTRKKRSRPGRRRGYGKAAPFHLSVLVYPLLHRFVVPVLSPLSLCFIMSSLPRLYSEEESPGPIRLTVVHLSTMYMPAKAEVL